jgi:hypothetical protein
MLMVGVLGGLLVTVGAGVPAHATGGIEPFPVAVVDPFSHAPQVAEQPDGAGVWQPVVGTVCLDKPLRLTAPEVVLYLADATKGPVQRLNFWSGGVRDTVLTYHASPWC